MILLNPKAPFIAGVVMIGLLVLYLTWYHPMPGPLSAPHAAALGDDGLETCETCHTKEGLTADCLNCHEEIAGQITEGRGFHASLLKDRPLACGSCHVEHAGTDAPLVTLRSWEGGDPNHFSHNHVTFRLTGAHEGLECTECHNERLQRPFALPRFPNQVRRPTYLGLSQECTFCHEDVHAGGMAQDCEACHNQQAFRPATGFRHNDFYVLEGAHAKAACSACHLIATPKAVPVIPTTTDPNRMTLLFDRVRGKTCVECHTSPHRIPIGADCQQCHLAADTTWAQGKRGMTPGLHVRTGFPLDGPHAKVTCEKCHPSEEAYALRHPDPTAPGYLRQPGTCQGCHTDVHKGQFTGRYKGCLDCHDKDRFVPSRFTAKRHTERYPLTYAHAALPCEACHKVEAATGMRRYVSTPRQCQACHQDPHGGQFTSRYTSCLDCHDPNRFSPALFSTAKHAQRFPLMGAHATLPCESCHEVDAATGVRRFVSTPRECQVCHKDPHGGQFMGQHSTCLDCHNQDRFSPPRFGVVQHARQFPLTGAHAAVPCTQCHKTDATTGVRRFVSTPQQCQVCHNDPHGGQFNREIKAGDCTSCHRKDATTFSIRTFDHLARTGYALIGAHAKAQCQACHRPLDKQGKTGAEAAARIYRGTSKACASCHSDVHQGQFQEGGVTRCERCHGSTGRWVADRFDHNRDSRFPLQGAHAKARCQACHHIMASQDGTPVVRYRPLGTRCEDCHGSLTK